MADLSKYKKATSTPSLDLEKYRKTQEDVATTPKAEAGLLSKLGGRFKDAGKAVATETGVRVPMRVFGAAAGAVNDTVSAAIAPVFNKSVDAISDIPAVQKFASAKPVSQGFDAVRTGITKGQETFGKFEAKHPELAQDVRDVTNIATTIPTFKGANLTTGALKNTVTKTADAVTPPVSKITTNFEKGIKPLLNSNQTPAQRARYTTQTVEAVSTIANNKANLKYVADDGEMIVGQTPKNLKQFGEAIEQTKKTVFEQYDALAKQAGEKGLALKSDELAVELDTIINNKALQLSNPDAVAYAQGVKQRFAQAGELDAVTAQDVIQNYNNSLQAFYRNPTPEGLTRASVDALMANKLRQSLDQGIEGLTGLQYQALKNQYASLKTIERDVMRAVNRDARKNIKGLVDFTDVFSGGQVVAGMLSMNPAQIAGGLSQKAIASYIKYLNSPNRAVENIFKNAERLVEPASSKQPTGNKP